MLDGRLAMAAQRLQGQAERPKAQEVVRVQVHDTAALREAAVVLAREVGLEGQERGGDERQGVDLPGALDLGPGLLEAAEHVEVEAVPLARARGGRAQRD